MNNSTTFSFETNFKFSFLFLVYSKVKFVRTVVLVPKKERKIERKGYGVYVFDPSCLVIYLLLFCLNEFIFLFSPI